MLKNLFRALHLSIGAILLAILIFDIFHTKATTIDFLSFFTIQSNILTALVFLYVGINKDRKSLSDSLRGAVTTYMLITGVAYVLLLEKNQITLPYPLINIVYHKIMPIVTLLSWIVFPAKFNLKYKTALLWLVFPLIYGIYTLIRGFLTNWYPYDFISPIKIGYTQVFLNYGIFALFLLFTSVVLIFIGNHLNKKLL